MCEIAIVDPDENEATTAVSVAEEIYESQGDSLGVVAIYENDTRERFIYDIYKAVTPDRDELADFIYSAYEDGAARLIIHGRMATHGAITDEHAHPLEIDCPECSVDYVLHNGVVTRHVYDKNEHEENGHEYNTDVDSEVIAHNYGEVPDDFDYDVWYHSQQSAFILLNEDRMFVSAGRGYHLTGDIRMQRGYRSYGVVESDEDKYVRGLFKPSEAQ